MSVENKNVHITVRFNDAAKEVQSLCESHFRNPKLTKREKNHLLTVISQLEILMIWLEEFTQKN